MIDIVGFGHINITVDCIKEATDFYERMLGAKPIQFFPKFKNIGFAKSAGFFKKPEEVEVSINFLKIPNTDIYLELMCYHSPAGSQQVINLNPNDWGGIKHICLRIKNINKSFQDIKNFNGVKLLSDSSKYSPCKLSKVYPSDFIFFDNKLNSDMSLKVKSASISSEISFFYFIDQYNVLWELEESPDSTYDPALEL